MQQHVSVLECVGVLVSLGVRVRERVLVSV